MRMAWSAVLLGVFLGLGQPSPAPIERGTLRLHYVQKPIGYERYEISPDGPGLSTAGALKLTADFDFTDRGGRVQLAATLRTKSDFTPLSFEAKGKSYRFVNVDSHVRVEAATPWSAPMARRKAV